MSIAQREVVVVGGGISGLTAAWHLKCAGVDVALLEAGSAVGGCVRTQRHGAFLLEKGPFNVIVRDAAFEQLLDDLSDEIQVVAAHRSARRRYIYRSGRLWPVPTNPLALATTGLFTVRGRGRLLAGLCVSPRRRAREETIEEVAVRRFGREVADTAVSAAVTGIFGGDIRRLSCTACFPSMSRVDAKARSLLGYALVAALRSLRHRGTRRRRRWRGLVSLRGGLGAVAEVLGRRLGEHLRVNSAVTTMTPTADGYKIVYCDGEGRDRHQECRKLVIALPAAAAGRLLRPVLPDAATMLDSIGHASLIVVNLGFRRTDIGHPMDGFGFLVPYGERDLRVLGVLWADSVFPHHAPADHRLIRVFLGGSRDPEVMAQGDDELVRLSMEALRELLHVSGDPVLVDLCRHRAAIPQYELGHGDKIERLKAVVAATPGLHLIGNYLEGISLNDCIRLATDTAHGLVCAGPRVSTPDQVCP